MRDKYDVIVVGAGPAGVTAAHLLAKSGLRVVIFERGTFPGEKNMFGGVLYGHVLNHIIPNYWEQAPLERCVTRRVLSFLTPDAAVSVELSSMRFSEPPYNGFTVLRSRFDRWYAQKAVEAGALLVPNTVVDDLIWEDGRVVGVQTRRDRGELRSEVVIAADGVNSLLAKRAGLRAELKPNDLGLGIKEVIHLPKGAIEERFNLTGGEGIANEFVGGLKGGVQGGAFLYTNRDSLSVGVVAQLESLKQHGVGTNELLEEFKTHPVIRGLVKDGVTKEYSAHLIPEAGLRMIPRVYTDGMLLVGDAAGLVLATGLFMEGMNYAMASGIAAATAVKEAAAKGDFSRSSLSRYGDLLKDSSLYKDLATFKQAPQLLTNPRVHTLYPELICGLAERLFTVGDQPRQKLLPLALREARNRAGIWQLLRDGLRAGGALLW